MLPNPAHFANHNRTTIAGPAFGVIRAKRATAPGATSAAGTPAGANGYDRVRDLPSLIPLWPAEITDETAAGRTHIVRKLRRALREERRRGLAGHWTYNLSRHSALLRAYRHEVTKLDAAGVVVPGA